MERKRPNRISVYFTDSELFNMYKRYGIDEKKYKRPNSRLVKYIRNLALGNGLKDSKINPIAISQYQELARLSANINQLSYLNNIGAHISVDETQNLLKELRIKLINLESQRES